MIVKMDSLVITDYCSMDKRKQRFLEAVSSDPLFSLFVSNKIDEYLEESKNIDALKVGNSYIVADGRKLIGYLRLHSLDYDGTLNLHYGVHPDFRRQHYGTKILTECKSFIFKALPTVNYVELYINSRNKGSELCAIEADYKLNRVVQYTGSDNVTKIYTISRN